MPRRFHPAFYIDNGLRSGVSCVGPLGDDRNPFLVQYLQFQCMPIEVFPNPTAPVTLTPKVACAMPAPWESSTLRIYQHDSSSVAHDFVRKTQKQKVTLLWKFVAKCISIASIAKPRNLGGGLSGPRGDFIQHTYTFFLRYIQVLWILVKKLSATVQLCLGFELPGMMSKNLQQFHIQIVPLYFR